MLTAACLGARAEYVICPWFAVVPITGDGVGAGDGEEGDNEGGGQGKC